MGHGSQRKHGLPRGSELDWDKLLESGGELMMNEMQSEDDDVYATMAEEHAGYVF